MLVFYPFAFSPVCNDQLTLYEEVLAELDASAARRCYAISTDARWSQAAFKEKLGSSVPQLSDFEPKGATARAFGVLNDGGFTQRALVIVEPRRRRPLELPGAEPGRAARREPDLRRARRVAAHAATSRERIDAAQRCRPRSGLRRGRRCHRASEADRRSRRGVARSHVANRAVVAARLAASLATGEPTCAAQPPPPVGDADHVRGERRTRPLVVIYGDFTCPRCAARARAAARRPAAGRLPPLRDRGASIRARCRWRARRRPPARRGASGSSTTALFADPGADRRPAPVARTRGALGLDLDRFERDRRCDEVAALVRRADARRHARRRRGHAHAVSRTASCCPGAPTPELIARLTG